MVGPSVPSRGQNLKRVADFRNPTGNSKTGQERLNMATLYRRGDAFWMSAKIDRRWLRRGWAAKQEAISLTGRTGSPGSLGTAAAEAGSATGSPSWEAEFGSDTFAGEAARGFETSKCPGASPVAARLTRESLCRRFGPGLSRLTALAASSAWSALREGMQRSGLRGRAQGEPGWSQGAAGSQNPGLFS